MESVASGSRDDAFHTIHTMGGWSGRPDDEPIEGGETASGRVVVEGGAPMPAKACAGIGGPFGSELRPPPSARETARPAP